MLINVNQLFLLLHRLNNFKVTGGTHSDRRPQAADRRLKNFKVTGATHLGWGWVRQYHSQRRSPTRAKVIAKVTQGHFQGQI